MGAKAEISWKRETPEGERLQVYARHISKQWRFFARHRRYDNWQPIENPPLEDWLALLDSVTRRVQRRLLKPDDLERLKTAIRQRFPEAKID